MFVCCSYRYNEGLILSYGRVYTDKYHIYHPKQDKPEEKLSFLCFFFLLSLVCVCVCVCVCGADSCFVHFDQTWEPIEKFLSFFSKNFHLISFFERWVPIFLKHRFVKWGILILALSPFNSLTPPPNEIFNSWQLSPENYYLKKKKKTGSQPATSACGIILAISNNLRNLKASECAPYWNDSTKSRWLHGFFWLALSSFVPIIHLWRQIN